MSPFPMAMGVLAVLAGAGGDPARLAETCHGSETIEVGDRPPATAPYDLAFSADLRRGLYCYGRCTRRETYRIANARMDPIALADVAVAGQSRRMTYSPRRSRLADDQVIQAGPIRAERHAVADCTPGHYRAPPAL